MLLNEITQNTVNKYKIFVDLDGVLVDFDKQMEKEGFSPTVVQQNKKIKAKFWQHIMALSKRGIPFWSKMDPMPDAFELWNYVKKYQPKILSATGSVGNAAEEKRAWVKQFLGDVPVFLVRKSEQKAQYAAPHHILIDDSKKSIEPWIKVGGIGILHKNAIETIQQLKGLGL